MVKFTEAFFTVIDRDEPKIRLKLIKYIQFWLNQDLQT